MVALVSAFTVPSFSGWIEAHRLKKAARQLATDLQFAKMKTVAEGVEYRISFDNAGSSYVVQRGDKPTDSENWSQVGIARQLTIESNPYHVKHVALRQNYPGNSIVFTPAGYAGMGTTKFSTGTCTDGTTECQSSPRRRCEKCVRTALTGRVALLE